MTQEQLDNLKIEDLEEVTEGYWPEGEEMILISTSVPSRRYIEKVFALVPKHTYGIVVEDDSGGEYYDYLAFKAYKIPTPKMRDMTSLEVMEYLHLLQLWCNGVKDIDIIVPACQLPTDYKKAIVVSKRQGSGGVTYAWGANHTEKSDYFGILKNGKITEFKIPQIEDKPNQGI